MKQRQIHLLFIQNKSILNIFYIGCNILNTKILNSDFCIIHLLLWLKE